jgi:hypothetical protein
VLTAPEPKPVKRTNKKSKSRTFSEPRSKKEQRELTKREPRHLPLTFEACQRELGSGPCPYVSCRHHLWSEQMGNGIKIHRFAELMSGEIFDDPDAPESCSLRLAARGALDSKDVGKALGDVTDERIRNVEEIAQRKLARKISAGQIDFMRGQVPEKER